MRHPSGKRIGEAPAARRWRRRAHEEVQPLRKPMAERQQRGLPSQPGLTPRDSRQKPQLRIEKEIADWLGLHAVAIQTRGHSRAFQGPLVALYGRAYRALAGSAEDRLLLSFGEGLKALDDAHVLLQLL